MTKINHNDWIEDTPEEKAEKDKIRAQIEFEMANPAPLVPPTEEEIAADKAMVEKSGKNSMKQPKSYLSFYPNLTLNSLSIRCILTITENIDLSSRLLYYKLSFKKDRNNVSVHEYLIGETLCGQIHHGIRRKI